MVLNNVEDSQSVVEPCREKVITRTAIWLAIKQVNVECAINKDRQLWSL